MNRYFFTMASVVLSGIMMLSTVAYGQDEYNKIHFGIKGGINLTGLTRDIGIFDQKFLRNANSPFADWHPDAFIAANFGVTADRRISDKLSLSAELLFNGRGGEYRIKNNVVILTDEDGNENDAYDTYSYQLYYIEVPLLVQYHLPIQDKELSFKVYGGVSPGVNMSAKTVYSYYTSISDPNDDHTESRTNSLSYVRNFNVSPVIGFWAGDTHSNSMIKFFGDLRFEYTFLPVFSRSGYNGSNLKTNMWTVGLGLGIRF